MNTIQELTRIVNEGEAAQYQLDAIAESIYDTYLAEIESQSEAIEKEFPGFDERVSELTRCNSGFHRYELRGDKLILVGRDYFRGETNTEYDTLPASVFIDDEAQRKLLIKEFVNTKFAEIRKRLEQEKLKDEQAAREQYEALKERFETK